MHKTEQYDCFSRTQLFWENKLNHLVRPQTGAAKKSVNQSQNQGLEFLSVSNFLTLF